MALSTTIYNTVFKRNSIFVGTVFFGAFAFGIGYDTATTAWWDNHNRGKQWHDIRDKFVEKS
ncbi:putative QCR9-ubiquinol--cytochrome-c reductase subunit 9 [Tilletiaria anomala UBC 951]|uniref:Complex III subunit 9 n=1 Tax=Tilletiaria anomala (strain ATCC 24038 / CBS 436.72 / UBC 951) TaxID=1037660 RepID=A0A066WGQ0_TILAU|nr:putative QCR9-ubiquinol--cytochrome-c reductase subunit 9 [Tilletiaria anomala UBC 951]KDN53177.1 putative QCR9-ubiquinol--cytochrome-c reductase subunit 9 [Tilletiaria anomala UBC 951]